MFEAITEANFLESRLLVPKNKSKLEGMSATSHLEFHQGLGDMMEFKCGILEINSHNQNEEDDVRLKYKKI